MYYRYVWKNNQKRAAMFMRVCRILVTGAKCSALVEFDTGQREVVSIMALRKCQRLAKLEVKTRQAEKAK